MFVTCLVDFFRPSIGFASVELLKQAGWDTEVPSSQTCCGQPAYNNGDKAGAVRVAQKTIEAFEGYEYIVAPSGSCAGMLKEHYPRLFMGESSWERRAISVAERTYELITFLTEVCDLDLSTQCDSVATYHDSCSGLRELGVKQQPRNLLAQVDGLRVKEMDDSEVCCGFGGTFCVKYPKISERMVSDKTASIKKTGADLVLGGDLGCLLNIAGRLRREGDNTRVFHVAEILAGMDAGPGIGDKPE